MSDEAAPSDDALLAWPTVFRDGIFEGRTVLVSGAGTGIGRAIACLFGRLGAALVLCGRNRERLERTAALLARVGATSLVVPTNIREPDEVDALFAKIVEHGCGLDVVVNNAGGQYPQASIDLSDKGWRAVVDTNLNGTFTMMQRAARFWRRADGPESERAAERVAEVDTAAEAPRAAGQAAARAAGQAAARPAEPHRDRSIVNIVAPYRRGLHGLAHTVAARAGVAHLAQTLAVEWAPAGIRINCVLPGPIATEGLGVYSDAARAGLARGNPLGRLGDVQDVAQACVYLAAPSGRFITGEVLVVDGGHQHWGELWMAGRPEGWARAEEDA